MDYGLTERMVSYLFEGSFKKQAKFNRFVQQWKETVTLTLEPVNSEVHSEKATVESRISHHRHILLYNSTLSLTGGVC